jgi:hypothetical protein
VARAGLCVLLLVAVLGTGCSLEPEKPESIPPPRVEDTPDKGKIGDAITVRGQETELQVRVVGVLDPAPAAPADTPLDPRARFVGVDLRLRNIGEGRYSESPLAGSTLLTAGGGEAEPVNLIGGPCGGDFALRVALAPGARRAGCVPFEVSAGERPVSFEFALDSGFAPEVGRWRLK